MREDETRIIECVTHLNRVRKQISRVIVGQEEVIDLTLIALLCEGHLLLEGVPGLGKTMLIKTLADTLTLQFSRIQFTPDLMPADVIGTAMIRQTAKNDFDLTFERGPIFANLVLADEINRASPKTQSALLEAMQEQAVTVRGQKYPVPRPFLVLATQNPLEMEGTYPLPEAQIDRFFFKVNIYQPSRDELIEIIDRTAGADVPTAEAVMRAEDLVVLQRATRDVIAPPHVTEFAARLVLATQPERAESSEAVRRFVRYGAGPRGAQALILAAKARALVQGRFNAGIDDLEYCIEPALRHRVAMNFDGQSEGIRSESLLKDIVASVRQTVAQPEAVRA
jgi:MoxR-like ATPase